jgi:hypothetical protein
MGSEMVGRTDARGGTDVYVGKGVGVDLGDEVGLGVQVGGKESEEEEVVSVSIRSIETLNVRFAHAETSASSKNGRILAAVVIFPLCSYLCNIIHLDKNRSVPKYSTSEKTRMFTWNSPSAW